MKKDKEETQQESFQLERRIRCCERKKEKERGQKEPGESGRVASQERKGREEHEGDPRTANFHGKPTEEQRE